MRRYRGFICKSRTYDAAALLSLVAVVEANAHLIQQYAGEHFGLILFGLAMIKWQLRRTTTGPVGEK